jgi:predicted RNase H-like HicB family nuclease
MLFTAVSIEVPEGFVAFVEGPPGANTQGGIREEAPESLQEAVALILETDRELAGCSRSGWRSVGEPFVPVAS